MNVLIESCGWISSALITLHMLPQLGQVMRDGHARGLSSSMLYAWLAGEVLAFPYAIWYGAWAVVAIVVFSTAQALVFIHYKRNPRRYA